MDETTLQSIISAFRFNYEFGFQNGSIKHYDDDVFTQILATSILPYLNFTLFDNQIIEIKKRVDSEFQIFQPNGEALLNDYEHESDWYKQVKKDIKHVYWPRYRKHLFNEGWTTEVLNSLEFNTLDSLMNYLGNPNVNDRYARKGLVMGDVQSGKTSNYIGLICKAVDAGYKVVILLTGILESLRRQTQIRVEEGFIGYDVENKKWVGVGLDKSIDTPPIPGSGTSRENDFTGISGENTFLHLTSEKAPIIFVTKKNASTLKKIRDSISNINLTPPNFEINTSLLVIDDEADNASVNTNGSEYDPTKINAEIRKLLSLFTKSNYVGFTATPFANVFIDPNSETEMLKSDLFPRDFIYSLNPPSNYFGAEKTFITKQYPTIQIIKDSNETFPLRHKLDWNGDALYDSLVESINLFLIANCIRDIRETINSNSHRSMLINVSRFIKVQNRIEELVTHRLRNILNSIRQTAFLSYEQYIENSYILDLHKCYDKHYSNLVSWSEIFSTLQESTRNIQIYKVPTTDKSKQLNYEKHKDTGLRAIIIGGLALSRGLTLEGLTISYLYRNTSTFDVLMQMGRWFGYRNKPKDYDDLCRVWMLEQTKSYFEDITNSIISLKSDIKSMILSKKGPIDFGIRVRNESDKLGITDRNKMRSAKKYVYTYDLYGQVLETPFVDSDDSKIRHNMLVIEKFLNEVKLTKEKKHVISKSLSKLIVLNLLKDLFIHEANRITYFEKDSILDFLLSSEFKYFDVVMFSGKGRAFIVNKMSFKSIERSFDMLDDFTIRVSDTHKRLGGRQDTKYGLPENIYSTIDHKSASNKTYMVQGRNPLFMIYPLSLKKPSSTDDKYDTNEKIQYETLVDKYNTLGLIPFGFSLGIPQNNDQSSLGRKVFYINDRTKWWNLMNQKDGVEDE